MVKLLYYTENAGQGKPQLPPSPPIEELLERLQPTELVKNVCRNLAPFLSDDFVEDVIYDTLDITDMNAENRFKATYPPAEMSTSSFVVLKQPTMDSTGRTLRNKSSPESFLKIVSNAYSGVQRGDGMATKLLCNLISQQPETDNMIVHGFEFDNEIDYWTFIGEIKRSVVGIVNKTNQGGANQSGLCHYLLNASNSGNDNSNNNNSNTGAESSGRAPAVPRKSNGGTGTTATGGGGGGGGFLGSLFSTAKETAAARMHRWEIHGYSLVITDSHHTFRGESCVDVLFLCLLEICLNK